MGRLVRPYYPYLPFSSFCKISAIALSSKPAIALSDYKTSLTLPFNICPIQAIFKGYMLLGIIASYALHIAFELLA